MIIKNFHTFYIILNKPKKYVSFERKPKKTKYTKKKKKKLFMLVFFNSLDCKKHLAGGSLMF